MATYTVATTAEQDILLGIITKQSGQTAAQIVAELTNQALQQMIADQASSFITTIKQNYGLQTLADLATTAAANPDPNAATK